MAEKDSSGCVVWGLVGCVGLIVTLLCAGTGVAVLLASSSFSGWPDLFPVEPDGPPPEPGELAPGLPEGQPPPAPFGEGKPRPPSILITAKVVVATGSTPAAEGDSCTFVVDRISPTQCHTQIHCGDKLLYGGERLGYFQCTVEEGPPIQINGADETTTLEEGGGDARMVLSTNGGNLLIADEGGAHGTYQIVAEIQSVEVETI